MRLTAAEVRTLTLPPGMADYVFFDSELAGPGTAGRATGAKTWMIQYAIAGRTRRMVLGSTAVLDPGKARETAKDLLAQVRLGRDPAGEKAAARARAVETFGALLPRFLERQRARLKPRSLRGDRAPPVGACQAAARSTRSTALTAAPSHAPGRDRRQQAGPAASNRVRTSLSAFFSWAAREGYVDANPAAFTNKAVENGSRERVLADDELAAIWRAAGDGPYGAIVKLLMLTGARRDEIASLRWSEIDLDAATITLPPAQNEKPARARHPVIGACARRSWRRSRAEWQRSAISYSAAEIAASKIGRAARPISTRASPRREG